MIRLCQHCFEQPLKPEEFSAKLSLLPESFQEKILRFRRWQDQHASLFGKLLVIDGFKAFGQEAGLGQMTWNAYGRPALPGPIDFNISHSGNYVVCVLSDEGPVGIDIEEVRPINFQDFTSFFTADELKKIQRNENPLHSFYELWTKKEAVIKAEGKGLSMPLQEIKIEENAAVTPYGIWTLKKVELSAAYKGFYAKSLSG